MNRILLFVVITTLVSGSGVGCTPSSPPKVVSATAVPNNDDADNPLVKEARSDTEAVLDDLLAGKYDNDADFAPVARKVKGFHSWSIESQKIETGVPKSVNFSGNLKGPNGEAIFTVLMVKQQSGKWMIGTFSGPNPK